MYICLIILVRLLLALPPLNLLLGEALLLV